MTKEDKPEEETLEQEAKRLGVTKSKVDMSGFMSLNTQGKTPDKITKEQKRQEKLANERLAARVAQKKIDDKKTPIEKRKELIVGRFKAVRSKTRAHTYTDKMIEAWTEEYNLIKRSPKQWIKITDNGKIPFAPGNKRKKTAKELLDSMNLED